MHVYRQTHVTSNLSGNGTTGTDFTPAFNLPPATTPGTAGDDFKRHAPIHLEG